MRVFHCRSIVFTLIIILSPNAFSDEVTLNNGDRLSGNIINKTAEVLTLKTDYADEIEILSREIKYIITDKPVHIILSDERNINGTLFLNEDSEQRVDDKNGGAETLTVQQIIEINPPVEPNFISSGQINLGVEIDRGNTDEDDYHLDAQTELRWPQDRITMAFEGDIEESDGRTTKQEAKYLSDYDHFITEKFYSTAGFLLEHNKFADLDLRTTINAGVGYQILENNRTNLSIEGSPGYLWENFDESSDRDYPVVLWRLQFDHYLFKDWELQAFHRHRYTQSLEDGSHYIFLSRTGLRIPLYENLQATLQYNFDRDNAPADDADKDDRTTLITAGYKW